eukprot:gene15404-18268_t
MSENIEIDTEEIDDQAIVEPTTTSIIAQNNMDGQVKRKRALHASRKLKKEIYETTGPFIKAALENINSSHQSLDSSRAWICYWTLHGLDLIGQLDKDIEELRPRAASYLSRLQQPEGGFAGGVDQFPHVVSTYAAVNAISIVGAYDIVDRKLMHDFLMRMKTDHGSFRTQDQGEDDSRSTYCAISIASLLNILTPQLSDKVSEYLVRCQTYEGGFGGEPGNEAHDFEGGFQGRTNKLVDTCYTFWQGGLFPILEAYLPGAELVGDVANGRHLCNQLALQDYCLVCCQDPNGGFHDHPEKRRDYYHTCYTLSDISSNNVTQLEGGMVLLPTHPVYNITLEKCIATMRHYRSIPFQL